MALESHTDSVIHDWIDRNQHMNLAYYVVVFDRATDAVFDLLGIGSAYTPETGNTMFAVESHTLYEREVKLGETVRIVSHVIGGDAKRLHLAHEMFRPDGARAAAFEVMSLNVGMTSRRVAPFPPDRAAAIASMTAAHLADRPSFIGRRIALPGS